jgi:hypothetical protein
MEYLRRRILGLPAFEEDGEDTLKDSVDIEKPAPRRVTRTSTSEKRKKAL